MCQFRRGVSQGGAQAQSEREKIPYLFREWIRHQSLRKLGQDWYHQGSEKACQGEEGGKENVSAKKVASMSQWRSYKKYYMYQILPE